MSGGITLMLLLICGSVLIGAAVACRKSPGLSGIFTGFGVFGLVVVLTNVIIKAGER